MTRKIEILKKTRQLLVRKPTFKTYYYFHQVGDNGELVGSSQRYTAKQSAKDTIAEYFPEWEVVDLTGEQ